jgi:hypothetical protein
MSLIVSTYYSQIYCDSTCDFLIDLQFFNDKCDLLHGDISISNIVIVRFLPSILAASLHHSSSASTAAHLPTPITGQQGESFTPSTATPSIGLSSQSVVSISDIESNQPVLWETVRPCTESGLPYNLNSGGSVIDFDYSRPKTAVSTQTSVRPNPIFALSCIDH